MLLINLYLIKKTQNEKSCFFNKNHLFRFRVLYKLSVDAGIGGTTSNAIFQLRHTLFIPHSQLLKRLFFITNAAVSLGWLRGK